MASPSPASGRPAGGEGQVTGHDAVVTGIGVLQQPTLATARCCIQVPAVVKPDESLPPRVRRAAIYHFGDVRVARPPGLARLLTRESPSAILLAVVACQQCATAGTGEKQQRGERPALVHAGLLLFDRTGSVSRRIRRP